MCYKDFITYRTVLTFGPTYFSTSGGYCFVDNFGMCNFFNDNFATSIAKNIFYTRCKRGEIAFRNCNPFRCFFLNDLSCGGYNFYICTVIAPVYTTILRVGNCYCVACLHQNSDGDKFSLRLSRSTNYFSRVVIYPQDVVTRFRRYLILKFKREYHLCGYCIGSV